MKTHKYLDEILKICEHKHLSVEEIYLQMKKKFPEIGRATIYRGVELLVKKGKMRKIININKIAYYETYIGAHLHFIDEKTGEIVDLDIDEISISDKLKHKIKNISNITIIGEM